MFDNSYKTEAQRQWDLARRKAMWRKLSANIQRKELDRILSFEEITRRLQLRTARYIGTHNIPLSQIVGSVGRYNDFLQTFLPDSPEMQARWQAVARAYLDPTEIVPPIEVYKISDNYFVKDGNHRVSAANQLKLPDIEARVWEYPMPEGLSPKAPIDALLIEAERQDFLQTTQLDQLRPEHNIKLTVPGAYTDLLYQIAQYQIALSKIDQMEMPYEQAVTAWYDMIYETTVQIIEEAGILSSFPKRTHADVFVWLTRYKAELEALYGRSVRVTETAAALQVKQLPWWQRVWRNMRKRS